MLVGSILSYISTSLLFHSAFAQNNATCHYPDGVANNGSPCDPDADVSMCCGPTFVCISNGLCKVGRDTTRGYNYEYYRSGCTDATWNSSSCPQFCVGGRVHKYCCYKNPANQELDKDNLGGGNGLQSCGNQRFCCAGKGDCCEDSSNIFSLGIGNIITTLPTLEQFQSSSTRIQSSDATQSSATTQSPPGTPAMESTQESHKSNGVAIGVGVGVGVGGLLIVLISVVFCLRRRKRAEMSSQGDDTQLVAQLEPSPKRPELEDTIKYKNMTHASAPVHELSGEQGVPHELEPHARFEMDGSDPGAVKSGK